MGPKVNMKYFLWNKVDRQNVVDARYSVSVYNHAVNAQNFALFSEQIPSEISLGSTAMWTVYTAYTAYIASTAHTQFTLLKQLWSYFAYMYTYI